MTRDNGDGSSSDVRELHDQGDVEPDACDRKRLLHVAGAEPFALRLVEIDEVLDRGGHRPLRCRLEFVDGEFAGDWVVKPPVSVGDGENREELSVLAELAGAEVCAWAGVATPAIGVMTIPDPIHEGHLAGLDPLTRNQLQVNAGRIAFCSRFLEDAVEWAPDRHQQHPRGRDIARGYGPELMLVDAYMLHDDRTVEKPNCLELNGRLVAIDHGSAFVGIDRDGAACAELVAPARLGRVWKHHVFERAVRRARKRLAKPEAVTKLASVPEPSVRVLGERWPPDLKVPTTRSGCEIMSEMLEFLVRRPAHTDTLWQGLLNFLNKTDA